MAHKVVYLQLHFSWQCTNPFSFMQKSLSIWTLFAQLFFLFKRGFE